MKIQERNSLTVSKLLWSFSKLPWSFSKLLWFDEVSVFMLQQRLVPDLRVCSWIWPPKPNGVDRVSWMLTPSDWDYGQRWFLPKRSRCRSHSWSSGTGVDTELLWWPWMMLDLGRSSGIWLNLNIRWNVFGTEGNSWWNSKMGACSGLICRNVQHVIL